MQNDCLLICGYESEYGYALFQNKMNAEQFVLELEKAQIKMILYFNF